MILRSIIADSIFSDLDSVSGIIESWLNTFGLSGLLLDMSQIALIISFLIIVCVVADFIARKLLLSVIEKLIARTKNTWDDVLVEKKVFRNVVHIVPAVLIGVLSPILFKGYDFLLITGDKISSVYLTISIVLTFIAFFKAFQLYLQSRPFLKDKPLESYMQLIRLIAYIFGGIYVIAILVGKSPLGIFSALGAMSVVLMLVFKDTILGFVGSIQIAANDMVKPGDWVGFPKYGADGVILEIKLQTVKVQNWDKTITTIPTYAFVSEAFKNWRGMEESGGRRIKRSIMIDMSTIKFCDETMLKKLKGIHFIADYLNKKEEEIKQFNTDAKVDLSNFVNGRRITNLGTFRVYVEAYLGNHPMITKEMTFLVRHLESSDKGLPIEIYIFSSEQRWAHYEAIQADIFDHLFAVLPEFDLKIFQSPSGEDFRSGMRK
jgi:miniconductance mechanosensitive channel